MTVNGFAVKNAANYGIKIGDSGQVQEINDVVVSDCIIKQNRRGVGLYYITSSDINRNVIANNSAGPGMYINHATSTTIIENNVITGNAGTEPASSGILLSSNPGLHTDPVIQHNTITNNDPIGVYLYGVDIEPQILDNEISGNTAAGIQTYITEGGTFTGNTIENNSGDGICLGAGQSGSGQVRTIEDNTITGNGGNGVSGFWFCPGNQTVTNNTISENAGHGIFVASGTVNITGNDIVANGNDGILVDVRRLSDGTPNGPDPDVTAQFNNINGNTNYGVEYGYTEKPSIIVDATNNWWGDASGPEDTIGSIECAYDPVTETWTCGDLNADGSGDRVSDNVDYCPWQIVPPAGPPAAIELTVDPLNIPADGSSTSVITASVTDEAGNPVADGTDVLFETDEGSFASSTVIKQTSDGVATATLSSVASTETIVATITATAGSVKDAAAVFFVPEGEANSEQTKTEIIVGNGLVDAGATVDGVGAVEVEASGEHIVTTAKYEENPGGTPTFEATGDYYDVHLDSASGVNSLTVNFCPVDEDTIIYYWDETSENWKACSDQVYDGGCVLVTITDSTSPSLSDLIGLPFATGIPTLNDEDEIDSVQGSIRVQEAYGPPPEPADFAASYLLVSPQQVLPNQQVEISSNIANHGGQTGTHSVVLYINGYAEQSQTVGVSAGSCQRVVFNVVRAVPGTYVVSVDGMQGQFTVLAPRVVQGSVPSQQDNALGTAGIIAIAVMALALVAALVFVFKES